MKWPAIFFLLLSALAGCRSAPPATGRKIATIADLNPGAMIPAKANLRIGEIEMAVDVLQTQEASGTTIELQAHGQVFEREVYAIDDASFALAAAAGETYKEPLPLLKFPLTVGDSWTWSGTMTAGEEPHRASAKVDTASEQILLPSGTTASVLVVVDLEIESGAPTPAKRKLRFWFVEDKGLVKRQFGTGSSREPDR